MSKEDVRWKQRLQSYSLALAQLSSAAELSRQRPLTSLEKQGFVQAFEFTHELAWNTLKDFLQAHGATSPIYGSKDATRAAFAAGLITHGEEWMSMIGSRNLTTHTYNEATADAIVESVLSRYLPLFLELEQELLRLEALER